MLSKSGRKTEKGKKSPKYEFTFPGQEPFGMAAVWKLWKNPKTDHWERTFAVLTGEPNELMQPVHDSMTTLLEPRDDEEYLPHRNVHRFISFVSCLPPK
jgi:putative SOS response-associated peptidase YedK